MIIGAKHQCPRTPLNVIWLTSALQLVTWNVGSSWAFTAVIMIEFNKIFDNFPISFGFFQTQRSTDIPVVATDVKFSRLFGGRCCHISGNGILCCWIELNIMLLLLRLIIIYKHFYENIYLCSKLSLVQSMKPYLSKSVYWKIRPRPSLKSAYGFLKMHKA